jgi:hypothetical protein
MTGMDNATENTGLCSQDVARFGVKIGDEQLRRSARRCFVEAWT